MTAAVLTIMTQTHTDAYTQTQIWIRLVIKGDHLACKECQRVRRCWRGYLSGARCRWGYAKFRKGTFWGFLQVRLLKHWMAFLMPNQQCQYQTIEGTISDTWVTRHLQMQPNKSP